MPAPTTFLLVRHAQTAGNLPGEDTVMGGWTDLPLTELGIRQAHALAARLRGEPAPQAVVASPLARATLTAQILASELPGLPLTLEPRLREISCGEADGLPIRWVQTRHAEAWAANSAQTDPDFRWPGGESYREFRARVLESLGELGRAHPGRRVLVVTHAGVISQVLGWMNGQSAACWQAFRPRNASVTELRWSERGSELVRFDEVHEPDEA